LAVASSPLAAVLPPLVRAALLDTVLPLPVWLCQHLSLMQDAATASAIVDRVDRGAGLSRRIENVTGQGRDPRPPTPKVPNVRPDDGSPRFLAEPTWGEFLCASWRRTARLPCGADRWAFGPATDQEQSGKRFTSGDLITG
jgi:hypothetical protein